MPPLDFPNAPSLNQLFAGPNAVQWQWDGSKWIGTPNQLGPIIVAASPPTFVSGQLWWDSTGGNLYLAYDDGNSQAWVPASNIAGVANAATKGDVAQALNDVGRNLVHNSLFNVAQRGNGPFTSTGAFTVDRWKLIFASDTGVGVQRLVLSAPFMADESPRYVLQVATTGNAAAGALTEIVHAIEDVRRLAGKTVTLSFYAIASANGLKIGLRGYQSYGTGGSPSGADPFPPVTGNSVTLTTGWVRYSTSFDIPTSVGKTLGTNGDDATTLQFWFSSGATNNQAAGNIGVQSGTFQLWGVQLEIVPPGASTTTPTQLEKPDPQQDLAKCQRFYSTGSWIIAGYNSAGATTNTPIHSLPVVPRATPTIAISGTPTLTNCNTPALNMWSSWQFAASVNTTALGSFMAYGNFTASADL